ncbi:MAG TPA: gliding motility-associated C-terminal domain-containing protein [Flavisolibacter sp.]|nr:gliding motility-associated C-terminal domain-containing protein [Flavisolibacter sp.]
MRKIFLLFSLLFSFYFLSAQYGNIWYFGNQAGLDFNSLPPKPLVNNRFSIKEGSATICDDNGNLLFYTDGVTVFTKWHHLMEDGDNLYGNVSSTQSSVIVPWPGKPHLYYLFTSDALEVSGSKGYNYSVIDMQQNGGMGAVITKNQLLYKPSTEKMAAALHCNGKDWWIITKQKDNNIFYTYLIDEKGINSTPIISSVGEALTPHEKQSLGGLTVSPNGKKVAMMVYSEPSRSQLFDFNNVTGQITNGVTIAGQHYMSAFSPNSKYLYVTADSLIKQFDLSSYRDSLSLAATRTDIMLPGSYGMGIKLGPDGKIYVSTTYSYLDVIHKPNEKGINCKYEEAGLELLKPSVFGLPSTIPGLLNSPLNVMVQHGASSEPCIRKMQLEAVFESEVQNVVYEWTFEDGSVSGDEKPFYTFPLTGNTEPDTFIVKLKVIADEIFCSGPIRKEREISSQVILNPPPQANAGQDTSVFVEQPLQLNGTGGVKYQWSPPEYLNDPTLPNPIARLKGDQVFTLTVANAEGCETQDQISVKVKVLPVSAIYVPNAFTPNKDGNNDYLKVFPVEVKLNSFQLFNRWGKLMFSTSDPDFMWDGSINSKEQPTGVYVWIVKGINTKGEEIIEKGTVLLIR